MSLDSASLDAWHMSMSLRNCGTNCLLVPCHALSSGSHINAALSALFTAPHNDFFESCNIVFNKGGPISCHECIILEPDDTPPSTPPSSAIPPPSLPSPSTPNSSSSAVPPTPSCPKHTIHPPIPDDDPHYNISSYGHHANIADVEAPKLKTYDKVMASLDAAEWLAACKEEMRTWKDLDIYDIVPQPKGRKVIGSKWVFHVKWGPNGTI
jgi:hypothetical protein